MRKIKTIKQTIINSNEDLIKAIKHYRSIAKDSPIFFDTETTGLNIKYDKPFLIPWGYVIDDTAFIYCVDVDHNEHLFKQTAMAIVALAKIGGLVGHNIKYDIHMLNNIGVRTPDDIHYSGWDLWCKACL